MKKLLAVSILAAVSISGHATCVIDVHTEVRSIGYEVLQEKPQQSPQQMQGKFKEIDRPIYANSNDDLEQCIQKFEQVYNAKLKSTHGCKIEKVTMRYVYNDTPLETWKYTQQCQQQNQSH